MSSKSVLIPSFLPFCHTIHPKFNPFYSICGKILYFSRFLQIAPETQPIPALDDLRGSRPRVQNVDHRGLDAPVLKHGLDGLPAVEPGISLKHVHPRQGARRDRQQLGLDLAAVHVGDECGVAPACVIECPPQDARPPV